MVEKLVKDKRTYGERIGDIIISQEIGAFIEL